MRTTRDPVDVAASIRRSIEVSQKGSRKVRCHTLRDLFGFQAWSPQRREIITRVLADVGIVMQPALSDAAPDDWVTMSLPDLPAPRNDTAEPRPKAEWFDHTMTVELDSEREVEMHFASPLFHALGYSDEQEAAGFRFETYAGVQFRIAEADLVYFATELHSANDGVPLILVEVKDSSQLPDAGTGQAKSYAYWIKPAYYVITNGEVLIVYNYQGGAVPDVKVLEIKRSELQQRFDELYSILNPAAAAEARRQKEARLAGPPSSRPE
jgi:Type I restriction enzyme R protein N terminus (HSDR_N)